MFALSNELLLLLFFALGSYIQATTGFAFGLIVMSSVSALGLAPIEVTAFAVSVLSLFNSTLGLRGGHLRQVNRLAFSGIMLTCVPVTFIGVWLLGYLGDTELGLLKTLLGLSIVLSSLLMMLQTSRERQRSSATMFGLGGLVAGLMGGMFGTFGPPLAYLMYRQPDTLATIRATLLAIFSITSVVRIAMVMNTQTVSEATWFICLIGVPVVALSTVAASRFPLPIKPETMRRFAFALLLVAGTSLAWQGLAW